MNALAKLISALTPPLPLINNPDELLDVPYGRYNLYIGGAGNRIEGSINLDLFAVPGVHVAADAHRLPFPDSTFQHVDCDAVLEHVKSPQTVMHEIERVLVPGGTAHIVVPFCHPFHEYPRDYQRFTPDGLRELAGGLKVIKQGWRTGPTATLILFTLEYFKLLLPWKLWRVAVHGILGWMLFPLRYVDLLLFRNPRAGQIGNHCYVWLRKPEAEL